MNLLCDVDVFSTHPQISASPRAGSSKTGRPFRSETETKFITDGMLGKLARWLRLIGNDVEYCRDLNDKDLIRKASTKNTVLLTSDVSLYRIASQRGVVAYLVKGTSETERLARIVKRFNLELKYDPLVSKCPKCSARIEETSKESVRDEVPQLTYEAYNEFWICTNPDCGKVYWRGSHWKNILETIDNTNKLLQNEPN